MYHFKFTMAIECVKKRINKIVVGGWQAQSKEGKKKTVENKDDHPY